METVKIKKFQAQRRYTAEKSECWFELVEREGSELTFKVSHVSHAHEPVTVKATAVVKSDADGVYEEARVKSYEGVHTIDACTWCSRGRKLSKLSEVRQAEIRAAIAEDVERRNELTTV